MVLKFAVVLYIMLQTTGGFGASFTNFEVKRFELCNNTQGRLIFHGNITKEKGNQYLSYNISTPVPWDENLGITCLIQTKTVGQKFIDLYTIRERSVCKAFNKYMGEFWYDIERASQVIVGLCPIREGRYHAHHVLLDFHKISLQTFPFGTLRFTMKAVDNNNPNINMWCILTEVENAVN